MGFSGLGYGHLEGHLGTSLGYGLEGHIWVNSRVNSGSYLVNSRPYSRKPHKIAFIWP